MNDAMNELLAALAEFDKNDQATGFRVHLALMGWMSAYWELLILRMPLPEMSSGFSVVLEKIHDLTKLDVSSDDVRAKYKAHICELNREIVDRDRKIEVLQTDLAKTKQGLAELISACLAKGLEFARRFSDA